MMVMKIMMVRTEKHHREKPEILTVVKRTLFITLLNPLASSLHRCGYQYH